MTELVWAEYIMTAVMTLYHYTARLRQQPINGSPSEQCPDCPVAVRCHSSTHASAQWSHHASSALPDVKIRGRAAIFLVISFSAHKFVLLADGAGRKMNQIVCNLVYLHELWTRLIELANKNSAQIPATANFDRGQPATVLLPPRPGIRYLGLYNILSFYNSTLFISLKIIYLMCLNNINIPLGCLFVWI